MNILIHVSALQKGFLMSLGNIFSKKKNKVFYLCRDKNKQKLIFQKINKDDFEKSFVEENVNNQIDKIYEKMNKQSIINEAKKYEKKYDINLSFILGKDRALGRGYLLNVDRYPNIIRANWEKEKKFLYFLNILKNIEKTILLSEPRLILSISRSYFISLIAKKYNIKYLTLTSSRIGNRFYWADNDFNTNLQLISKLKKIKNRYIGESKFKYAQIIESKQLHANIRYGIKNIIIDVIKEFIKETKQILKNSRRKNSYYLLGWVPVRIRKYFAYNYILKNSKKLNFFKKNKFIYIPLHLEPEIALIGLSPEFNNTLEMITWVSKSLPAEYSIVIKEQPFAYGTRSLWFYKILKQMPNVYLADPKIHPWEWIKNSFCVSTITGTAAYEAVHFKKPVISFGKNQIVNYLKTVKYCSNFFEVNLNLFNILKKYPTDKEFETSKNNLINSIFETSFELNEYIKGYNSTELNNLSANTAIKYINKSNDRI